ncbi:MAG: hypothetical protein ACREN1_03100 [Candidatus Dormibacteria bacterium]
MSEIRRPTPSDQLDGPTASRDASSWAQKVDRLELPSRPGVRGLNVAGRRLTGPIQGFGRMWQKTYRVRISAAVSPASAVATWKANFPEFWPKGNRFAGALSGISPGDVAMLDLAIGGGVKLSTGVFVLYADDVSFTLMTPQGHMFAGWISFSAEAMEGATVLQVQVLMRANDPLYELGMTFGGHAKEDRFWSETLTSLAARLGTEDPAVEVQSLCVDRRRQWRRAGNVWHNSMVRSLAHTALGPLRHRPQGG